MPFIITIYQMLFQYRFADDKSSVTVAVGNFCSIHRFAIHAKAAEYNVEKVYSVEQMLVELKSTGGCINRGRGMPVFVSSECTINSDQDIL